MRKRAAHLGRIVADGVTYRVVYRSGVIQFIAHRSRRGSRTRSLPLLDAFNLAEKQSTFAFFPKP